MLVDVKIGTDPVLAELLKCAPRRIGRGVYDNCGFNFHNLIQDKNFESYFDSEYLPEHGVADSIEQCMEKLRVFLDDPQWEYAIGFTEVVRAEQPQKNGWRWRKWGQYIGEKKPTTEYLYDEPDIDRVVTFSVVRRSPNNRNLCVSR